MRVLVTVVLFLTGCQHFASMTPQQRHQASIHQHCAEVGRLEQARRMNPPSYNYGTPGQPSGTVTQNPGGFWGGYNAAAAGQAAERECLLRHRGR